MYKRIELQLSNYMGRVFEEICMQYLWKQLLEGNAPIEFVSLGRWWGNDPIQKAQAEIDIMGERDSESALFAECKWRNEKVDIKLLTYTSIKCFELITTEGSKLKIFIEPGSDAIKIKRM